MKGLGRFVFTVGKWLLLALFLVEAFCFLIVVLTNLVVFGAVWEGGRVNYDPYALFLDRDGVRSTAHNPVGAEAKHARRFWMFGGSTTRCSDLPEGDSIASRLALRLNGPGSRQPVVVTNYGQDAFNSLLETKYLQKLLIEAPAPPDLVIFYDGANDCAYFNQFRTAHGHYGYRRVQGPIESYGRSLFGLFKALVAAWHTSYTKEMHDRWHYGMVALQADDPDLQEMVAATVKRYDHVRRLAACYGADFVLFWQPLLWIETGEVAADLREQEKHLAVKADRFLKVRENFTVIYDALAAGLQERPYFVDFRNRLCARRQAVYMPDGVHLKAYGNDLVAQAMVQALRARGW